MAASALRRRSAADPERGFEQGARMGTWKGVRHAKRGPLELYDLRSDPAETRDLAKERPDVVRQLEAFLAGARTDSARFRNE